MRVKAVVVRTAGQPARIEGLDVDEPREGEILVRLAAAGVARHDLDALAGTSPMPLPFVPGSEAAGIVERVGPGVAVPAAGSAVLVAYAACRSCSACAAGDPRHCERFAELNLSGRRGDGTSPCGAVGGFFFGQSSFATHLICRAGDAIVVGNDVALEIAAVFAGEFLRGAGPVLRRETLEGTLDEADAVVIAGAGIVGLAGCLTAKALGAGTIILAEPDEARGRLALEVGATHVVPDDNGLAAVVASLGGRVRLALDAVGTVSALRACLACAGTDGICVSVASDPSGRATSADTGLDPSALVPRLVALHAAGALPVERLIDFFPFEHVGDALAASGEVVKAVLRFPLGSFGDLDRASSEGAAVDDLAPEAAEPADTDAAPGTAAPVTA